MFFAIIFPLMFLVLFGGIFNQDGSSRIDLIQVGGVELVDRMPDAARAAWDETFETSRLDDLDDAVAEVRRGDADVALHQDGDRVTAYFTQTDQTRAAMTRGALRAFVDGVNVAASGRRRRTSWTSSQRRGSDGRGAVTMANFLVLPMAFLSRSFFPLDLTPTWLQTISLAMPLRHLNDAMLDVMVRGDGPGSAVVPMLIMLGFATALTLLAARLFRWETL